MKVLGVLGSPRIKGNSDILLDHALAGARNAGAEIEKIILVRKKISGCLDCKKCNETGACVIQDDMQDVLPKIVEADSVIHSVPVYFWSMTAQMKAYMDRWCALFDADWQWQKQYVTKMIGKRIGLITVCGAPDVSIADPIKHVFETVCSFTEMNWLEAVQASAGEKGAIDEDEDAKRIAYQLGRKAVS